jgi:hypothetical protein
MLHSDVSPRLALVETPSVARHYHMDEGVPSVTDLVQGRVDLAEIVQIAGTCVRRPGMYTIGPP